MTVFPDFSGHCEKNGVLEYLSGGGLPPWPGIPGARQNTKVGEDFAGVSK